MRQIIAIAIFLCLFSCANLRGADLVITPANVLAATSPTPIFVDGIAGATITAGQAAYKDSTDGRIKLADCDDTAAKAEVVGVAVNGAANGQPIRLQTQGKLNLGATLVPGALLVLSATAGGIAPAEDLAAGHRVTLIGIAVSANQCLLKITPTGAVIP
jgi:hypothetical protein